MVVVCCWLFVSCLLFLSACFLFLLFCCFIYFCLFVCLLVGWLVDWLVGLFVCLFVGWLACLLACFACLFVCVCLFVCLLACLLVCLLACLLACLLTCLLFAFFCFVLFRFVLFCFGLVWFGSVWFVVVGGGVLPFTETNVVAPVQSFGLSFHDRQNKLYEKQTAYSIRTKPYFQERYSIDSAWNKAMGDGLENPRDACHGFAMEKHKVETSRDWWLYVAFAPCMRLEMCINSFMVFAPTSLLPLAPS